MKSGRVRIVVSLILMSVGVQADIVLNSMESGGFPLFQSGYESVSNPNISFPFIGNRFTTGNGPNMWLSSVRLDFAVHGLGGADTNSPFRVRVYYDNAGTIDNTRPYLSLTGSENPPGQTRQTYSLQTPSLLETNTTYWLVAFADGTAAPEDSADYGWYYNDGSYGDTAEGWQIHQAAFIAEDFGSISTFSTPGASMRFSINAIPEPATVGLIGVFGGALLFIHRREAAREAGSRGDEKP